MGFTKNPAQGRDSTKAILPAFRRSVGNVSRRHAAAAGRTIHNIRRSETEQACRAFGVLFKIDSSQEGALTRSHPVARLPHTPGQQAQRQEQLPEQREHRPRNPAGGVGRHAEPLADRRRRLAVGAVGPVRTAGCIVERVERRAVRRGVPLAGGIGGQTRPEGNGRPQQRRRPAALAGPPLGWALPGHESPEPRSRAERPTGRRRGVRGDETASRWKRWHGRSGRTCR